MSVKDNNSVYCIEYFYAKAGCRDKLANALLALVEPTRAEPGCLQYDLLLDNENPDLIILLVKFASKEMMIAHENSAHVQHFVEHEMKEYCEKLIWNDARKFE